jgi:hypothetical protein
VLHRRMFLAASATTVFMRPVVASPQRLSPTDVLHQWYGLILELARHTPTYTPPVAARTFAYVGVAAFECVAALDGALDSLSGQVSGLKPLSLRNGDKKTDLANALHAALQHVVAVLFNNTGPTGQRVMKAVGTKLDKALSSGVPSKNVKRSRAFGVAVAEHILNWSRDDGGADIHNLGFPESYTPDQKPGSWLPTSAIRIQQAPLLPAWGANRTFTANTATGCGLSQPPAYSEDKGSEFFKQATEVFQTVKNLTQEQRLIARFWSDDPMLSPTPPGHWVFITLDILKERNATLTESVEILARLGMAVSDAFVACWKSKYDYNTLRPVTYIKKMIDKTWEPILITPPFPEYPSGHSTQSGAAAEVLTAFFGEGFSFEDKTHVREKLPLRRFTSFHAAAEEAAISRLYGGIHFRAACELGLVQGRCVGKAINGLRTRKAA